MCGVVCVGLALGVCCLVKLPVGFRTFAAQQCNQSEWLLT